MHRTIFPWTDKWHRFCQRDLQKISGKWNGTIFPWTEKWPWFRLRNLQKVSRKCNGTIFPWTIKTQNHISLNRKVAQIPFERLAESFQKWNGTEKQYIASSRKSQYGWYRSCKSQIVQMLHMVLALTGTVQCLPVCTVCWSHLLKESRVGTIYYCVHF